MKPTIDYLDAVKEKLGLPSDNAMSKVLGVTRAAVSRYRKGICVVDDDVCFTVARILDINPLEIVVAAHLERAKDNETQARWINHWNDFSSRFVVARHTGDAVSEAWQGAGEDGRDGRS
jgi:predicted transcriptional regulator